MDKKDSSKQSGVDVAVVSAPSPVSKKWSPRTKWIIVAVIILLLACFGVSYLGARLGSSQPNTFSAFPQVSGGDGNAKQTSQEENVSAVTNTVSPSVVSIVTSLNTQSFQGMVSEQAAGTGMIISKNGYIMTNKHVVSGANSATIILSNGTTYKNVPVVGADPLNDIAFLKIPNVSDLAPVTLGDSKTVRVGQSVIAIGNALGQYQNTVTSGIISGVGRPVQASSEDNSSVESLSDLLQTDAAINSGNSGGPLLNMSGQVIGMNTAVAQGAQGIGFAIPIGATKGEIAHLLANGQVARAFIGVQYVSITPAVKAQYNLPVAQGDYLATDSGSPVQAGSPGAAAGLKGKDIITAVNGVKVGIGSSTSTLIGEFQPGDTVQLTVLRGGSTLHINVTLGQYTGN